MSYYRQMTELFAQRINPQSLISRLIPMVSRRFLLESDVGSLIHLQNQDWILEPPFGIHRFRIHSIPTILLPTVVASATVNYISSKPGGGPNFDSIFRSYSLSNIFVLRNKEHEHEHEQILAYIMKKQIMIPSNPNSESDSDMDSDSDCDLDLHSLFHGPEYQDRDSNYSVPIQDDEYFSQAVTETYLRERIIPLLMSIKLLRKDPTFPFANTFELYHRIQELGNRIEGFCIIPDWFYKRISQKIK